MEIIFFIKELREKGVVLKLIENQLEITLLHDHIDDETLELLKKHKQEVIAYLSSISTKNKFTEIPKTAIDSSYAVSNAQLRIWLESQSNQASAAYNMPFEILLKGTYQVPFFKEALHHVIKRHEILRTVFNLDENQELRQYVLPESEVTFEIRFEDYRKYDHSLDKVNNYIKKDAATPFNLEKGPLLRAAILQYKDDEYVFYCNLHHIICDAWSIPVLKREILTSYQAFSQNIKPALPALRIQYKDYSAWHLQQLNSESLQKQKAYWREKCSNEIPVLEFPLKQTRPVVKTYNGQTLKTNFSSHTSALLKAYADQNNASLFMVMLGTLHIMLSRYTGADDIIIGTPVAAREHADLQNQVGFYTNTLAIRNVLEHSDSFDAFFSKVKQGVLDSYVNQQYPFEELVKDLNLKKDPSRNPLFDVMLVVSSKEFRENTFNNSEDLQSITKDKNTTSKFDLLFYADEAPNNVITFKLEYNTDLFEEALIVQFIRHYEKMIHLLLTEHKQTIAAINYLTENEGILKQESETGKYVKRSVIDFFENQVKRTPENIALQYEDITLTYKQINEYTNQLAHCLREKHGVTVKTNVGVYLGRSHFNVLAMIGVIKSGACYVPVDYKYNAERKKYILEDAAIEIIISAADIAAEELSEKAEIINLDQFEFSEWNTANLNIVNQLDDASFIIYTSGSTGNPKGVVQTHRMLSNLIQWNIYDSGIESGLKHLQYTSFSFDVSLQDCWFVLSTGGTLYVTPESMKIDFKELSNYVAFNAIEVLCFPFSALINFFDSLEESFIKNHKIKHIISSGEQLILSSALEKFLLENPKVKLHNHYGPSETHVVTSCTMCEEENDIPSYVPIGKPVANTTIYLLDKNHQPVPQKVIGEIYVGGEHLALGYLNLPDLTNERFIANPFQKAGNLYKTGDLAYQDYTGSIIYLGRNDDQVKIRGYRIELAEIKGAISMQESVTQSFVEVVTKGNEQFIAAYVAANEPIDRFYLKKELGKVLPDYMVPSYIILVDAIPLTSNGKINKKALPEIDDNALITAKYTAPETALEKQLSAIWKELLGVDKVGIFDNFFELGGHSLKMHKMLNRIKTDLAVEITFELFLSNPTIESIVAHIENLGALQNQVTEIPQATLKEMYPLTSSQLRFWILCQMENINSAYNLPLILKLEGDINANQLQQAVNELVKRHEILRTHFVVQENGVIAQKVLEETNLQIEIQNAGSEEETKDKITQFIKAPFALKESSFLKILLLRKSNTENYLCINIHHIISDGASLEILLSDLAQIYNNINSENPVSLPVLAIQFKDYAEWVNDKENVKSAEKYWLEKFSGELPLINLPVYQPRPVIKTYNGAAYVHSIGKENLKKARAFSSENKGTLFMSLMAAVNGLLYRYTSQTDIILGTPVSGRNYAELQNQIGLYINTLPIRMQFEENSSFQALFKQQKQILEEAYSNSGYSFDQLVDNLNLTRDISRSPLFDILIAHQQKNDESVGFESGFDGLKCSFYNNFESTVSKYDITFTFFEDKDNLSLSIEYNTDLFEKKFIENLAVNYENFLAQSIDNSHIYIKYIKYLNADQTEQLLYKFNNTAHQYDQEETNIAAFQKQAVRFPEKTALVCEGVEMSYKELDEKSTQLALYLHKQGVMPNTMVGVCLGRSMEMMTAILGILKSGGAYLPLDPFYPLDRIDYILKQSNTKIVLADQHTKDMISKNVNVICVDSQNMEIQEESPLPKIENTSLAYVIYTSGSTGKPKGVKISHKNLTSFMEAMNQKFTQSSPDDVWLAMTSISFDISVLELLWTLTRGCKVVIHLERPVYAQPKPEMDFSLFYFPSGTSAESNKYKLLTEGAVYADKHGFKAIWVPERHFHDFGDQFPNPSIAAAAVSTITKNIKLRSGSVVLPLHDPVRVAEEWSMIDNLSEGRVELSIASGWHPNDFVLAPDNYQNRHQLMREKIEVLKNLWRGDSLIRKNGIGKDFEFTIHPKPIQKEVPIWITAAGSVETFKYAGSIGSNVLTHLLGQSMEDLGEKIEVYRQSLQDNGFDPEKGKVALMLHTYVSDDEDLVKKIVEEPFKNYLKNSLDLLKPIAEEQGLDLNADAEKLLDMGFLRYYKSGSLFGTPEKCLEIINKAYSIKVDEIACLIDFGVEEKMVLENLDHLFRLKEMVRRSKVQYDCIVERMKRLTKEQDTAALIHQYKVTHMQATPSFYEELLLDVKTKEALQQIKTLLVGGEALKKSLAEKLISEIKTGIHNMYGPTETTIWSSVKTVKTSSDITIGNPISNTKIYILDAFNQLCPVSVSGELCIGGDGVSLGYLNNDELTQSKFIDNPFESGQKIYKTGDLACWKPDGELEYQGRIDSQVKIKGHRIELKEIENVILQHKAVVQCAVTAFEEKEQTFIAAYIKTASAIEEEKVKEFLRLRLPHYMIPQQIVTLDDFPQTPSGKIDFKKLPLPNGGITKAKNYAAPKSEMEKKLSVLWSDYLKLEQISVEDNFFEIGGNSMKAFQLLSIVNAALNVELEIISFFQYPTIRTLAENLTQTAVSYEIETEKDEMENVEELMDFMSDL
ncbi:amino acid adenylation domain-containing protein [Flavobacterium sp. C3NV]|uniref:amino acid adenylation domain-containing protein n=1 Tax=Flavobacterium sp. C3NV TaxID=3393358 RepID=UPI00399017F2